jgi:hypothetical protein
MGPEATSTGPSLHDVDVSREPWRQPVHQPYRGIASASDAAVAGWMTGAQSGLAACPTINHGTSRHAFRS